MKPFSQHSIQSSAPTRHVTSFVGREQDLSALASLLDVPACRLVTLVGAGGIGKTRLAIEVLTRVASDFPDGACYVPLQAVRSADFLISAITDALAVKVAGRVESLDQVLQYLRDKKILLVIDNFEHLLDGIAVLTSILQEAPGVKLLITSRETLNLQEEWLYRVHGLSVPADAQSDGWNENDAVQLFAARARQVRHTFVIESEARAIVRICRLVGGMPLAIELAAAWLHTLSAAEIADEIERSLDFLSTSHVDVPERHRSMRIVFDHSWQRLSTAERDVMRRLTVFWGGFRRTAATEVAGATLPMLTTLVGKSLLRWNPSQRRYEIHALMCQYVSEEMTRSRKDIVQACAAHCDYFAQYLSQQYTELIGERQPQFAANIEAELDNIRAAWRWADERRDHEQLRRMASPLGKFFQLQSRYREAVSTFEGAVHHIKQGSGSIHDKRTLIPLLMYCGGNYIRLGRIEEAEEIFTEAEALYHDLNIPPVAGENSDPAFSLGLIALIRGDYPRAWRLGERVRQRSEKHGHLLNMEVAYKLLAQALLEQGKYDEALPFAEMTYAIASQIGDRWFMAHCLNTLGDLAYAVQNYGVAVRHYEAGYKICEEFNDLEGMALALVAQGNVAGRRGDHDLAGQLCRRSAELYRRIGDKGGLASALEGLGRAMLTGGDYATARRYLHEALELTLEIQYVPRMLDICYSIGRLFLETGETTQGLDLIAFVQRHPASTQALRASVERLFGHDRSDLAPRFLALNGSMHETADLESIASELLTRLAQPLTSIDSLLTTAPDSSLLSLVESLSDREQEVLNLIAEGLKNREIADRLSVSPNTIKTHINHIYGKLGVTGRVQAINRASKLHLL